MNELKKARKDLYVLIERGTTDKVLEASQHLDKLILKKLHHRKVNNKK